MSPLDLYLSFAISSPNQSILLFYAKKMNRLLSSYVKTPEGRPTDIMKDEPTKQTPAAPTTPTAPDDLDLSSFVDAVDSLDSLDVPASPDALAPEQHDSLKAARSADVACAPDSTLLTEFNGPTMHIVASMEQDLSKQAQKFFPLNCGSAQRLDTNESIVPFKVLPKILV